MTLRDISYIAAIAEEKSITKAAARLYVAQPALSQCLQKVEKEIGCQIFIRTTSGVAETEEGKCFLSFANTVLWEQKNFEKQLLDVKENNGGEVRLGLTGTQATYVLPNILPQFTARFPKTRVTLIEKSSDEIEKGLTDGQIDIGILHPPVELEGIECFELSHDDLVIIPRSKSRYQQHIYYLDGDPRPYLHTAFLEGEPLALTATKQRSRMIMDQIFLHAGISPNVVQVSKSLRALDALAQVDYATVLLPSKQLSAELKRRSYFYFDPKYSAYYSFYVGITKNAYRSQAAEHLLALLRELAGSF